MDISVVIPLYNEAESLPELFEWIARVMKEHSFSYEVIMVDDGSRDASWQTIGELAKKSKAVRGIRFMRNYGKSAALYCGFRKAEGDVVITMDADLQDSPDEIPALNKMITEEGYDVVSGWKQHRKDNKLTKNLPSKLFNAVARRVSGTKLHDMNCGLKAYRSEVVKNIEVYGEMHRYIPYIAKNAGYSRIGELKVHHQKRKYGRTKFGMSRFANGLLDLISLWFLSTFGKKPMYFFGYGGLAMFFVGSIMAIWIIAAKLIRQNQGIPYRAVSDQPLFYLSLLAVVLGVMFFLAGFIGEMIARSSTERNRYNIREELR